MSQEIRNNTGGDRGLNRKPDDNGKNLNYEGFEGMNYEQVRQPYNQAQTSRKRPSDERKESKRPDEG